MTLLADREYTGKKWFKFLKDNGLNFVVCLKWADFLEEVNRQPGRKYQAMYQRCTSKVSVRPSTSCATKTAFRPL
jgi:hypothetical protein